MLVILECIAMNKCTLLFILLLQLPVFSQKDVLPFLKKNNGEFYAELQKSALLDAGFSANRYIFLGEIHGFAEPQQVDLALFKRLNSRDSFNYYIAEIDDAKAWLLNEYLATGNELLLEDVFYSWKQDTAQWSNKQYFEKFRELHAYQQSLPAQKKFTVVGVDQPQDLIITLRYFKLLFTKTSLFVDEVRQLEKALEEQSLPLIEQTAKILLDRISSEKDASQQVYGINYVKIALLLNNLQGINQSRDFSMYQNLKNYVAAYELETKKMYGFLGMFHCLQTSYNNVTPFAQLVRMNMSEQTCTILGYYTDGFIMMPYIGQMKQMLLAAVVDQMKGSHPDFAHTDRYVALPYSNSQSNPFMEKVAEIEKLEQLANPSSVHLFRLTGKDSPFNKQSTYAQVNGAMGLQLTNKNDATTKAFQYILLIRNVNPASPR